MLWSQVLLQIALPMAKLPDLILTKIFTLQRSIVESLDATTSLGFRIFERWGETAETVIELEELQNIEERLRTQHTRLNTLLLKVARSQPVATKDMLDLLYQAIDLAEATLDASIASLQEIECNWD
jgi:cell shape-determining protein MreC